RDVEGVGDRVELDAVRGVVLLGTRQAPHQVLLLPAGAVPGQAGDDAGVGVEVGVEPGRAAADPGVARGHIDDRAVGGPGHQDAGDLPVGDAGVECAVVVVVRDGLDGGDFFGA